MTDKTITPDTFLDAVPEPAQAALRKLRAQIRAAAPDAEEYMGYGVPAFRQDGALVSYAAAKAHCSFFVQSPETLAAFAPELDGFGLSKGTIRFQPDHPIPAALVKRIVKARLAENARLRGKAK